MYKIRWKSVNKTREIEYLYIVAAVNVEYDTLTSFRSVGKETKSAA